MQKLKLTPEKRPILTQALRGALEILQMPQLELGTWLLEQVEKNPLLEISSFKKTFRFEGEIPAQISLHEHLLTQIRETLLDKEDRKTAYALLEHLDERGFLLNSYETLKSNRLERVLTTLQSFDPPGIFARNMRESLLIQLKVKGKQNHLSYHLVNTCFDDLLHSRFSLIKKKLGSKDLSLAIQDLARLSLQPANCFKNDSSPSIHIDLQISKVENNWNIELVEEDLPSVQITSDYLELYREGFKNREMPRKRPDFESGETGAEGQGVPDDASSLGWGAGGSQKRRRPDEGRTDFRITSGIKVDSSEEKEALRTFKIQANWILHSLKRRRKLLLQLGKLLICKQWRFLEGKGDLVPLSVKELSETLGFHESTLSRALSGKYAQTPRGILPLKALISIAPQTLNAKQMLQNLIRSEESPLTDDQLAKLLREKGFNLSRRTIAKYRSQLKIGSVNHRRASTPYLDGERESL